MPPSSSAGGGFAFFCPRVDAMATQWRSMGLAVSKAAQHKVVGLLAAKLKTDNIYVGEVIVFGLVKGAALDRGAVTIEPSAVAAKFWEIYQGRTELSVQIGLARSGLDPPRRCSRSFRAEKEPRTDRKAEAAPS